MTRPGLVGGWLLWLCACAEAPSGAETPTAAPVVAAPAAAPVATPTPASDPRAAVERPARRSASEAEKAALLAYKAEMQAGRTHTKGKAYAEAIAAFDRALGQRPQEPRALAERGYAKLLAGDLAGARADLEAARERSDDPARLGPIWFNLGLVEEKAGDAEAARRAFTQANTLRPGKAVQAKLAGQVACTAEIERTPVAGKRFASWKALYDQLMRDGADEPGTLSDPAEIQKALCHEAGRAQEPLWDLCFYPAEFTNSHSSELVGPGDAGALVHYGSLGSAESGACQNGGVLTVRRVGSLLHARYVEFGRDWVAIPAARRDADCESEYDECELECRDFSATVDDYVIDPAGAQRLLRVRRTTNAVPRATGERQSVAPEVVETGLPVRVEVGAAGVTIRGGGCDETVALAAAGR